MFSLSRRDPPTPTPTTSDGPTLYCEPFLISVQCSVMGSLALDACGLSPAVVSRSLCGHCPPHSTLHTPHSKFKKETKNDTAQTMTYSDY